MVFLQPNITNLFSFSNKTSIGFSHPITVKHLGIIYKVKLFTLSEFCLLNSCVKLSHTHIIYKSQNFSIMEIDSCH